MAKKKTDTDVAKMSMQIELWQVDKLKPYGKNPRKASDAAISMLAGGIKTLGFRNPIQVDSDGVIIAGHTRLMAAKSIGITEVPVIVHHDMSPEEAAALRIADNKLGELTEWDTSLLMEELAGLNDIGFDVGSLGFDENELDKLLGRIGDMEDRADDEAPEPPTSPVTVLGDIWILGNHRIICGDSTDAHTVEALLGPVKPHLMVTDPPYGVNYDANWRNEADRVNGKPYGARAVGQVENDDRADWSEAYALFPGDVAYVWHASTQSHVFANSLEQCGFDIRALIIWAKQQFAIGRGNYHHQHEPCWYVVRKRTGATAHWAGDRKQTTLWQINKPQKSETGHSTQKPVECMKRPIENNSNPGQAVYEPFSGSGTTIIAAEMTGRHCYAIELNPAYVDVAVKRWQHVTGNMATLESSGETFDTTASGRGVKINGEKAKDKAAVD